MLAIDDVLVGGASLVQRLVDVFKLPDVRFERNGHVVDFV
jgi:hypothetical protein